MSSQNEITNTPVTPVTLTDEQREWAREWAREEGLPIMSPDELSDLLEAEADEATLGAFGARDIIKDARLLRSFFAEYYSAIAEELRRDDGT